MVSVVKIFKSRLKLNRLINQGFEVYWNTYLFNARDIVFTLRSSFRRAIPVIELIYYLYYVQFDYYIQEMLRMRECVGYGKDIIILGIRMIG